jgi:hypothetical protein
MTDTQTTKTSTIYRTWCDRIDSGTFTKGECGQWAHAVLPIMNGERGGGFRTNLTQVEAITLADRLRRHWGVDLTAEHTEQGLAWLERFASKRLPMLPSDWRARFRAFRYMGTGERYDNGYVPIWRIVLDTGEVGEVELWDYYANSWQSGRREDYAMRVDGAGQPWEGEGR